MPNVEEEARPKRPARRTRHRERRDRRTLVLMAIVAGVVLLGGTGAWVIAAHTMPKPNNTSSIGTAASHGRPTNSGAPSHGASASSGTPSAGASKAAATAPAKPGASGPCATPGACGFPDASSTGFGSKALSARNSSSVEVRTDGQTISGWDLHGSLDVYANNVTVIDSRITSTNWWGINLRNGYTGLRILHCVITGVPGQGQDNGGEDYGVSNMGSGTIEVGWTDLSEFGEAISMGHGKIHDNYVHDLSSFINQSGGYEHTDAVISDGADSAGLVLTHNTFLNQTGITQGASASVGLYADNGPVSNTVVEDNWIAGGSYSLYGGSAGANGVQVIDNVFSNQYFPGTGYYGIVAHWNKGGPGNVWSGNRTSAGKPVPEPPAD